MFKVLIMKSVRWAFDFLSWTPNISELLVATSGIQLEEKNRIGQFFFQKDARSALVGRLLLRKFISESCQIPWSRVILDRDENGKPFVVDRSDVKVNISHQGSYVVLAGEVGDCVVGIDVMEQKYSGGKSKEEFFRLMDRNFSRDEWSTIISCPPEEQIPMFFRHWTLKESYVKATGTGITVNLQEISFQINTKHLKENGFITNTKLYLRGMEQSDWLFEETLLGRDHCVAVAMKSSDPSLLSNHYFEFLTFPDIISNCEEVIPKDVNYCNDFLKKQMFPR